MPQPLSEGAGGHSSVGGFPRREIGASGFIGGLVFIVVATVTARVAVGFGGLFVADIFARGQMPGLALGAEVGAEERGVCAVALDAVAGLAGIGFAAVTGFPAGTDEAGGCGWAGCLESGGGFVGIDGIRVKTELA